MPAPYNARLDLSLPPTTNESSFHFHQKYSLALLCSLVTLDEMRMKTAFTPFTVDEMRMKTAFTPFTLD